MSGNFIEDRLILTEQKLHSTFEPIEIELIKTKKRALQGLFSRISDLESLYIYFQAMIDNSPVISSVIFANELGDEFMLMRKDSLWCSRITLKGSEKTNPVLKCWHEDDNHARTFVSDSILHEKYDPRTRPWYKKAIENPEQNEINWTTPYFFFSTGEPGISAVTKWKDQNGILTVFAIDVLLSDLSEFTIKSDITANGKVFIISDRLEVLGLPRDPRFTAKESRRKYELKKLSELGMPLIDEALQIHGALRDTINQTSFYYDNEIYWTGAQYYNLDKNQKLILGVVIPEKDFSHQLSGTRNLIIGGLVATFVFLIVLIYLFINMKHATNIIRIERDKNEQLLLNTLPAKVVADLRDKGISEPRKFSDVTVFFSDIVGFTEISSGLEPGKLIVELNRMYSEFDDIMQKNGCERIKTIGDAYMAVCGMPEAEPMHAINMILASRDMLYFIQRHNEEAQTDWKIRIGLHSGEVVGGIVGIKKYIYDVFGDTINTASRMESNSEPMHINISQATYALIKNSPLVKEHNITFKDRESINVKGKGLMKMYFVHFPEMLQTI